MTNLGCAASDCIHAKLASEDESRTWGTYSGGKLSFMCETSNHVLPTPSSPTTTNLASDACSIAMDANSTRTRTTPDCHCQLAQRCRRTHTGRALCKSVAATRCSMHNCPALILTCCRCLSSAAAPVAVAAARAAVRCLQSHPS
eukprot:SAG31_NODE_16143_length_721_cov_1.207395_2_plen_144_part_00